MRLDEGGTGRGNSSNLSEQVRDASEAAEMNQERQRLRPWLVQQIDSGRYPGVTWMDQSARVFQIPWKHAARHGWNMERDAALFRNWAIHTGRYKPGVDKPDPKTWKANFRCALRSLTDVEELEGRGRRRGQDAFRVYALRPDSKAGRRRTGRRSASAPPPLSSWGEDFQKSLEEPLDASQGLLTSGTDQDEQADAVLKIVDHLKSPEPWSETGRSWRRSSTWTNCLCDMMDFTYPDGATGEM